MLNNHHDAGKCYDACMRCERLQLEFRVQHSELGGFTWGTEVNVVTDHLWGSFGLGKRDRSEDDRLISLLQTNSKQLKHNNSELGFGDMLQTE